MLSQFTTLPLNYMLNSSYTLDGPEFALFSLHWVISVMVNSLQKPIFLAPSYFLGYVATLRSSMCYVFLFQFLFYIFYPFSTGPCNSIRKYSELIWSQLVWRYGIVAGNARTLTRYIRKYKPDTTVITRRNSVIGYKRSDSDAKQNSR